MCATAECVGDMLGGGGGDTLGAKTAAVDFAAYGSHVTAAVMVRSSIVHSFFRDIVLIVMQMGDPRYITAESAIHVGTCEQGGLFPREADQSLSGYDSVIKSYCDEGMYLEAHHSAAKARGILG